jgi:hypothetical protein
VEVDSSNTTPYDVAVPTPHDDLFKHVFSTPENAASELVAVLPTEVAALLDWSTLELRPGSFVDPHQAEVRTDLLYAVQCNGREAFVHVLFEHLSSNNDGKLAPFRLLRYCVRIWESFLKDHPGAGELPAIIPIVLHHSNTGWSGPTVLSEVIDLDAPSRAALSGLGPELRFLLDDISHAEDADLHRRTFVAAAALFLLRDARRSPDLLADLGRLATVLRRIADAPGGLAALSALLEYASRVADVPPEKLEDFVRTLGPVAVEAYMTTAQRLTEQGEVAGQAKFLLRQLALRFAPLPEQITERVRHATPAELEGWADRVITAATLDEVFH